MSKHVFFSICFTFFRFDVYKVVRAYASQVQLHDFFYFSPHVGLFPLGFPRQIKDISQSSNADYRVVLAEIIGDYLFR